MTRRDSATEVDRQLSTLATSLARSVRTGATLLGAFEEVGPRVEAPLRHDVERLLDVVGRGVGIDRALEAWRTSRPSPTLELLVAAARFGQAHGGDLAAALDAAAVAGLDRAEMADEARALASQARTSATALASLPLLGLGCFSVLDPSVLGTLFGTPLGVLCLVAGAALNLLGALSLRWMTGRALR